MPLQQALSAKQEEASSLINQSMECAYALAHAASNHRPLDLKMKARQLCGVS